MYKLGIGGVTPKKFLKLRPLGGKNASFPGTRCACRSRNLGIRHLIRDLIRYLIRDLIRDLTRNLIRDLNRDLIKDSNPWGIGIGGLFSVNNASFPGTQCACTSHNLQARTRQVCVRLPEKRDSNSHGAKPVHLLITMIRWIRTSRLSIKCACRSRNLQVRDVRVDRYSSQFKDNYFAEM